MDRIRQLVRKNLLLEKRIGQLVDKLTITFAYDIDRRSHAFDRATRGDIEDYNTKEISNGEIVFAIESVKREISEKIAKGEIVSNEPIVVKSIEKEIALVVNPMHEFDNYWKLMVITVFRESRRNPFRVGKDQVVLYF